MGRHRRRSRRAALGVPLLVPGVVLGVLTVQLGVPAAALDDPRPSRFGWHMYSVTREAPAITAVHEDGTREVIDLLDIAAHPRPEIDFSDPVTAFLCRRAEVVRVEITEGGDPQVYEC